jgi:hypothetical protein
MRRLLAFLVLLGCADDAPAVCHFPSGRPCRADEVCLGSQGGECNYVGCAVDGDGRGELRGTAVACAAAPVAPAAGGPFVCDPGAFTDVRAGVFTPPRAPCPLGGLWTIEDGFWGTCVPVAQCLPLPCDPAYGDDGCPSSQRCDDASRTCR